MPQTKSRNVGTLPPYLAKQRAVDVIGCSVSLATKMATEGDVRVLVSADGRTRMLHGEDVEAIARERRAASKTK